MSHHDREIVPAFERALAQRIGAARFETWFVGNAEFRLANGILEIRVANRFYEDWLRRNFRDEIDASTAEVLGRAVAVEYRIDASITPPSDQDAPQPQGEDTPAVENSETTIPIRGAHRRRRRGRRFSQLSSFVVGDANRVAIASAEMVARQPGSLTPLVLYGPTGVGKTHLLEGIWCATRKSHPQARVVFLTAEQFTSYFLEALRGSGLPNFRRKYRGVDLLIIDDLQFFAGKRATLVELLYTVNTLLEEGRQIVLAADRSPAELRPLGEELINRLQAGMACRVDPPDFATRLEITRRLARKCKLGLPEEVARFVASRLTASARQLAGAINRLQAISQALERPVTLPLAREALADLISHSAPAVGLREVDKAVCDVFGLDSSSLRSDSKSKRVSQPRMLAMWLARKYTRAALSEIGDFFGGRTHSTVISARNKVDRWIAGQTPVELNGLNLDVQDVVRRVEDRLRTG